MSIMSFPETPASLARNLTQAQMDKFFYMYKDITVRRDGVWYTAGVVVVVVVVMMMMIVKMLFTRLRPPNQPQRVLCYRRRGCWCRWRSSRPGFRARADEVVSGCFQRGLGHGGFIYLRNGLIVDVDELAGVRVNLQCAVKAEGSLYRIGACERC